MRGAGWPYTLSPVPGTPRMKTSPRMRWPRSVPACWSDSSAGQKRPDGESSGRRQRKNSVGRRLCGEFGGSSDSPGVPPFSTLAMPLRLHPPSCRLAQEEVTPSPQPPPVAVAPAGRGPGEEEVGPRRGDFTRLEYERRAQLKLMDDLDKVLRPRAGVPGRGGRRGTRPRSGCCDDSALARSPARGLLGEMLGWLGWGVPAQAM